MSFLPQLTTSRPLGRKANIRTKASKQKTNITLKERESEIYYTLAKLERERERA